MIKGSYFLIALMLFVPIKDCCSANVVIWDDDFELVDLSDWDFNPITEIYEVFFIHWSQDFQ